VRRVKCDEGRPACLRCTSAARVCDGYNDAQPPRSSPSNRISIIAGPSSDIHASTQSHRSFSFFVQRTSPQLAGFFGSDFWERIVLQTAYHEPAVRHAVVAVGSLHEMFEHQTVMIDANKVFALKEYNLAIKHLLIPLPPNKKRRIDICLITCILFICFEVHHILHMVSMSCYWQLLHADLLRICRGAMPQEDRISDVAQSYCVKPCMKSGMECFNTKFLVQKLV